MRRGGGEGGGGGGGGRGGGRRREEERRRGGGGGGGGRRDFLTVNTDFQYLLKSLDHSRYTAWGQSVDIGFHVPLTKWTPGG